MPVRHAALQLTKTFESAMQAVFERYLKVIAACKGSPSEAPCIVGLTQGLLELQVTKWLRSRGTAIQHLTFSGGMVCHVTGSHFPSCYSRELCLSDLARLLVFYPESRLAFVHSLPRLESLDLSSLSITAAETTLEQLQRLQSLTSLSLGTHSSHAPLQLSRVLSHLTRLRHLRLTCTGARCSSESQAHLMHTVSKLTGLTCLDLSGTLTSIPAELSALDQLEVLCVRDVSYRYGYTPFTPFTISSAIESCTRLEHLTLDGVSTIGLITKKRWQDVWDVLLLLPRLQHLVFRRMDTQHVDAWRLPPQLTALELYDDVMSELPAAICNLPLLQKLTVTCGPTLHWRVMSPHGAKLQCIPNGPYLRNLQQLEIDCPFPTADVSVLADAKKLPHISIQYRRDMFPPWTPRGLQAVLPKSCTIELLNEPKGIWVVRSSNETQTAFVPALMSQWHEDTAVWSETAVKWLLRCFAA